MEENKEVEIRRFKFKVSDGREKPAIWFSLKGREVAVYPFELFGFLWDCARENYFARGVMAEFQIFSHEIWGYFKDKEIGVYHIIFDRQQFIDSAMESLLDMCHWCLDGKETLYGDYKPDVINRLLVGIESLQIPNHYSAVLAADIKKEKFSFEFTEPYSCDTAYKITIGNRTFESCLSDWTTNFNSIRLQMESFAMAYLRECEIELHYEDSPTKIHLNNRILHHNKGLVTQVTIFPDSFVKGPICYGWCDQTQVLSALYLGLMSLCFTPTDWLDRVNEGYSWDEFRLATYNKLQSCVIENRILGIGESDATFLPRQRIVNSIEKMTDDYAQLQTRLKDVK
ncbi:MAG: hypothetical protein HUK14_09645 [Muribaculaceae bacterium]|nr:hypothetical protein [Muribaculaceae bacterium]